MKYTDEQLNKIHKIEIEIAEEILRICQKNNLKVFANGGTLLGIVRHGGFIPWDDDMDLAMMRDDYEKFLATAPNELSNEYELSHFSLNKRTPHYFIKVMKKGTVFSQKHLENLPVPKGIFVDIFPFDYLPDNLKKRRRVQRTQRFWQQMFLSKQNWSSTGPQTKIKSLCFSTIRSALHILLLPFSRELIFRKFDSSLRLFDTEPTNYIGTRGYSFTVEAVDKYFPLKDGKFETLSIPIPFDSNEVLKKQYGDYMKLPSEDKRVNHAPTFLDFGDVNSEI